VHPRGWVLECDGLPPASDRGGVDWRYACCVLARRTCPQNDDNSPRGTTKRKGVARGQKKTRLRLVPRRFSHSTEQGIVSKWSELSPRTPTELPGAANSSVLRRMNLRPRSAYRRRLWIGRWPARLRLPSPKRALTRGGRMSFNPAYE
jgi:hypothetical protein